MDKNTPLWQLTVGEFQQLMQSSIVVPERQEKDVVVGNTELAKRLGVSKKTITNYKVSGRLDGTYKQIGRKIIYDFKKVIEAIKS